MNRTKVITALNLNTTEEQILVQGWVRNYRKGKSISFVSINDGSTIKNIQIVVENSKFDDNTLSNIHTGSSLSIIGLVVQSQGSGQKIEISANEITVLG